MSTAPWGSLGLRWIERDWLSANMILFAACDATPSTVVDTGHARHAAMTVALVDDWLAGAQLGQIVNTHLHSDHCGGNAALQRLHPGAGTAVPAPSLARVQGWQEDGLTYRATGQTCPRFVAGQGLWPGGVCRLGATQWQVHAAPGHDPDAVMLFEPQTRTLIAGDALWEQRLAIIFPELEARPGFAATRATLDLIEQLAPRWVIPGHGPAFEDVPAALAASRERLAAYTRDPRRHHRHAARALAMFHLMECQPQPRSHLEQDLVSTPLFQHMWRLLAPDETVLAWAASLVQALLDEGHAVDGPAGLTTRVAAGT